MQKIEEMLHGLPVLKLYIIQVPSKNHYMKQKSMWCMFNDVQGKII